MKQKTNNPIILIQSQEDYNEYLKPVFDEQLDILKELLGCYGNKVPEEILNSKAVCELLTITRPTLHSWRKRGIIQAHFLGRKVFFLKSEILESLKKQNNYDC